MAANKISQSYTMEQFIALGKAVSVTYDKYSFKEILSNGTEISILNVVNDYMREIKEECVTVKLSDTEAKKYRYKPKLLCYDVYGAQEVYFVILLINGIIDVKEFDFTTLLMPTKDKLNQYLSDIYNAEYRYIKDYNGTHGTA